MTIGDVSSQPGAFERVRLYTKSNQRLHMAYTVRPLRGGFDWPTVSQLLRDLATAGNAGWPCWSLSNHDVERAVPLWSPRRDEAVPDPAFARLLMALLLSLRGSVSLCQGDELGLPEAKQRPERLRDPFGIAYWPAYCGRDGSRTPMPWQAGVPHGGFTTVDEPWLPVPEAHRVLAVDQHEEDGQALPHALRRFLAWRRRHPALIRGTPRPIDLAEPVVEFIRELDGEQILAAFSLSASATTFPVSQFGEFRPMPECGFCADIDDRRVVALPPFGVFFAARASVRLSAAALTEAV